MVKHRERNERNDATNGKFDSFAQAHKRLHVRKRAQNEPNRPENVRVSCSSSRLFKNGSILIALCLKGNGKDKSSNYF
jgi:hypothetical protein